MEPIRVLLVDDEPLVAEITSLHLQAMGHDVSTFLEPSRALDELRSGSAYDLLVTDYAMPGMTGLELAKAVMSELPDLHVIFMTGFSEALVHRMHELGRKATVLHKPFRKVDLVEAVTTAMEQPTPG